MHASPPGKGGQRPSACISSRITTVIQVGEERATKGTITDLMSHSQFHCTGRAYLDMHGLIFETSICYWQRVFCSFIMKGNKGWEWLSLDRLGWVDLHSHSTVTDAELCEDHRRPTTSRLVMLTAITSTHIANVRRCPPSTEARPHGTKERFLCEHFPPSRCHELHSCQPPCRNPHGSYRAWRPLGQWPL